MKKIMVLVLTGLLCPIRGFGQEIAPTRAAAEKLLNLFNMKETYEQTMRQTFQMSSGLIDAQNIPEAQKEQVRKTVEASMKITLEKFSWDRMKGMFVDIYAEVLTLDELNGLIDFYESPIGRQFIKKQPRLTTVTMKKMQALMQEVMPEIQKKVGEAVERAKKEQAVAPAE